MNVQEFIHEMRRQAAVSDPDAVLALAEREAETIDPQLTIEWALMVKDLEGPDSRLHGAESRQVVAGSPQ